MDRRTALKKLGLGGVATALAGIPVVGAAAKPSPIGGAAAKPSPTEVSVTAVKPSPTEVSVTAVNEEGNSNVVTLRWDPPEAGPPVYSYDVQWKSNA